MEDKRVAKGLRFMGFSSRPLTKLISMKTKKLKLDTNFKKDTKKYKYLKREDNTNLKVLIIKPKNQKNKVGILWIHGGGYVTGSPATTKLSMAKHLSKDYLIVSPKYTLAVYAPYPKALEDCYQTLCFMHENAKELEISKDSLVVGGESAGGGLAIAVCLYARDQGKIKVKCQIPLYPMIDDRMNTSSMINNNAPVWNHKINKKAWATYLRGLPKEDIPKYAAPARETDYSNLPPAITFVGSIEAFKDETTNYIERLKKENIKVAFKIYPGCYHAFDMIVPWSKQAHDAKRFVLDNFKDFLIRY